LAEKTLAALKPDRATLGTKYSERRKQRRIRTGGESSGFRSAVTTAASRITPWKNRSWQNRPFRSGKTSAGKKEGKACGEETLRMLAPLFPHDVEKT